MVPQDSPLVALAQQGAEAVDQIVIVELSAGNHRGEPSVGNQSVDQSLMTKKEAKKDRFAPQGATA
jgi:hypothetical protein